MEEQILPIVPFGKYKDKSVLELLADENYVKWLKQQPWFSNQKQIYNIVVNQTISSTNNSKTPEHNKLQNLFLEDDVIKNLGNIVIKSSNCGKHKPIKLNSYNVEFEGKYNWDCIFQFECDFQCLNNRNCCSNEFNNRYLFLFVEIKPILGDDYPCVLRKMKTQIELIRKDMRYRDEYIRYSLIIKDFNSNTTSKENLIKIFKQSNIKILFIDQLIDISSKEITTNFDDLSHNQKKSSLEEENRLLQQKLLQAEDKIKILEEKIKQLEK